MIKCQFCGSDNEIWYAFCQNCGKKLLSEKVPGSSSEQTADDLAADLLLDQRFGGKGRAPFEDDALLEQATTAIEDLDRSRLHPGSAGDVSKKTKSSVSSGSLPTFEMVICLRCQRSVPEMYTFCGYCGIRLGLSEEAPGPLPAAGGLLNQPPVVTSSAPVAMLVRVREDGSFESGFAVREGEAVLGREVGDLTFPSDALLSKRHVRISCSTGRLYVEDLGSTNGTFLRLRRKTDLKDGDYLLIGKQLLRYEAAGGGASDLASASASQTMMLGSLVGKYEAKLVKRLPSGKDSNEYPLLEGTTIIGREKGDLIFKNDPYVSSKHAKIQREAGGHSIEDLNSSNGTYLKLKQKEEIGADDFFIVGEQLFQVRLIAH